MTEAGKKDLVRQAIKYRSMSSFIGKNLSLLFYRRRKVLILSIRVAGHGRPACPQWLRADGDV
jgi:hypothetical protein